MSYRLRLNPEHIDMTGFERLIRAGQAALRLDQFGQAAGYFREALVLWRGRAIVGLQAHGLSAGPMEELQHHVLNRTLPRRGLLAA